MVFFAMNHFHFPYSIETFGTSKGLDFSPRQLCYVATYTHGTIRHQTLIGGVEGFAFALHSTSVHVHLFYAGALLKEGLL